MNCDLLEQFKNQLASNISGVSAFAISLLSLVISWKAYKRDDPRLSLNVYAARSIGGAYSNLANTGLAISIANLGKNPVKLGDLGGRSNYFRFKSIASYLLRSLTPKKLEPLEFLITGITIDAFLKRNGQYISVPAGDRITFIIPDPEGKEMGEHLAKNASSIHISDAVGNRYKLPGASFSKLKRDYKS